MEESENSNANRKCKSYTRTSENRSHPKMNQFHQSYHNSSSSSTKAKHHHHHHPALLPLPPPPIPLQLALAPGINQNPYFNSKPHVKKPSCKLTNMPLLATPSDSHTPNVTNPPASQHLSRHNAMQYKTENGRKPSGIPAQAVTIARRPDPGGVEGAVISLLANHFRVRFDPAQQIFHYNVEITPNPPREIARMIKHKLVEENTAVLSSAHPAFDGRKNLYSPIEFQHDRLDFFISLPIPSRKSVSVLEELGDREYGHQKLKLFRINMKLVSKLDGKNLSNYLNKEEGDWIPLPQDYLHALDVILRESPSENCISIGRSMYSCVMGGSKEIGGGAVGMRGFFQSLRPTQQGLALNVDFSVTAFHESIGVIPYLEKRLEFLRDLSHRKLRYLNREERKEVEKALMNIRIFVCHRETVQRYKVYSLTEYTTEDLCFPDKDGKNLRLLTYFKDHYNYEIQFRNLPCLQVSRSKPCYLPMELCMICEGQKFLGRLSDDQTAKILKMGCQRPKERKTIIDGVIHGPVGPTSGNQEKEFKLHVSREMTRLNGRILQPPKLKLGNHGYVKDLVPSRQDRNWNLLDSHVFEGSRIEKWALISFGGNPDQRSNIPKFISQLSQRCEQLGIFFQKNSVINYQFEPNQMLNNVATLESKLRNIKKAASGNLQLLLCVMERKHKGYADLKRIAETTIGVISQCCLYSNLGKLSSHFLANLALKINAKVGGCTVALYNSLPSQIPRVLHCDQPVIFMGADVTHPHPLDDFSPSIAAVVASMNWPAANKYISRMRSQTHRQEIIQDLGDMVAELLDDFQQDVKKLPERIIFFRDGVSETQFYKVLKEELQAIKDACSRFPSYKPAVTFAVVQKRHHTRLFPDDTDPSSFQYQYSDENIPPGTVVDTVITHPKEFDFYLCSHWGIKGTSRPTHYHVLVDENKFTSDELQKLVYNLCYTFVRCTKPISLVPPAYYAHLAAYRGRLYLDRSESSNFHMRSSPQVSRAGPPKATPLPKLSENVKKLMFYC